MSKDLFADPAGLPPAHRRMYPADWVVALMRMKSNRERLEALEQCPEGMRDAVRNVVRFNLVLHSNNKEK